MPNRSKKPEPPISDNGGFERIMPHRKKKLQPPVLFTVPKGSHLAEMLLSGREQRQPPEAITEQQTPDRTADSSSASITQTPDQHADNTPSQLHGLLQNQPEYYCSLCKEATVEIDEEEGLVVCSQCGQVLRVLPIPG